MVPGTTSLANFLFKHSLFCRNNGRIGHGKESHYFTNVLSAGLANTGARRIREGRDGLRGRTRSGDGAAHDQAKISTPFAYYTITGRDDKCMKQEAAESDYERARDGRGPPILHGRLYRRGKHVDATPVLSYPGFAGVLSSALPPALHSKLRFIVLLREPVERDISMYNHMVGIQSKWGFCKESLDMAGPSPTLKTPSSLPSYHDVLAANLRCWRARDSCSECTRAQLSYAHYAAQLTEWFAVFGRQSFFVINSDTLKHNASAQQDQDRRDLLRGLGQFLGVPANDEEWERMLLEDGISENSNSARHFVPGRALSAHELSPDECKAATNMYRQWNQELYALLNATQDNAPPMQPPFSGFQSPCGN